MQNTTLVNKAHEKKLGMYTTRLLYLVCAIIVVALSIAVYITVSIKTYFWLGTILFFSFLVGLSLWFWCMLSLYISFSILLRVRNGIAILESNQIIDFSDEGLLVTVVVDEKELEKLSDEDEAGYEIEYKWSDFVSVNESKNAFYLNQKGFKAIRIAKDDNKDELSELFKRKIPKYRKLFSTKEKAA